MMQDFWRLKPLKQHPESYNLPTEDLTLFTQGLEYLELSSQFSQESLPVQDYLVEHPQAEESLEFLQDILRDGRLLGLLHGFWADLCSFVEGFQYSRLIKQHGETSEFAELFKLENPHAENDLNFYQSFSPIASAI